MPRILINENDYTSPGTPADYSNYDVLITGFWGLTEEDRKTPTYLSEALQPDDNGVYEFSSVEDFIKTIGKAKVTQYREKATTTSAKNTRSSSSSTTNTDEKWINHYGNQMAYELLNMGYSIIYKPIKTIEDVQDMASNGFWDIFKDKATYDFRFITHGFLSSSDPTLSDDLKNYNKLSGTKAALDNIITEAKKKWTMFAKSNFEELTLQELLTKIQVPVIDEKTGQAKLIVNESTNKAEIEYRDMALLEFLSVEYQKLVDAYAYGLSKVKITGTTQSSSTGGETTSGESVPSSTVDPMQCIFTAAIDPNNSTSIPSQMQTLYTSSIEGKYVTTSLINEINTQIANLAEYVAPEAGSAELPGRGDCIALVELDKNTYITDDSKGQPEKAIIESINCCTGINAGNGKYCAVTVPSVYYKMAEDAAFGNNKEFPGAFHYLSCFMQSLKKGYAEWYAAAGYNRGTSSFVIDHTEVKLGEIAINALEPRANTADGGPKFACNVIANFRGSYYLWGNRTAYEVGSVEGGGDLIASHFLNIRQLCTTIKKQLYVACRRFTFDPNSDTLWYNFVNAIRPTLEAMKADQGVRDYQILRVTTDKKATLKAKIRIIPIEAVEDFDLTIDLEDSFGETNAVVSE